MKIKICGLCRPEDAEAAAHLGADYVGVILAPGRARSQGLAAARRIFDAAAGPQRVGVFIDPTSAAVEAAIDELSLDIVQLHGGEAPETVRELARLKPVWKSITVGAGGALVDAITSYAPFSAAIVLDGGKGGTGTAFDWTQAASLHENFGKAHFVLAGGLTPDNVGAAVATVEPDAVDVSSGVESAPGMKSSALMQAFIQAARAAFTKGSDS